MRVLRDFLDRRKQKKRVCDYCGDKENNLGRVMFSHAFMEAKAYWHERCFAVSQNKATPNYRAGVVAPKYTKLPPTQS